MASGIWDVEQGTELESLTAHSHEVHAVAISSNDKWLASGSGDKTIKLWDLANRKELANLDHPDGTVRALSFSADSKRLASAGYSDIKIWQLEK